jgi:anti-anti-sigma regulatory factor
MQFKIDTSEKFTTITVIEPHIYDNMAAELAAACNEVLQSAQKNAILNLRPVSAIDTTIAENVARLQQKFYEQNASFVVCELKPEVEAVFEELDILELLNLTPTLSEAWDIIQMEEIERELMDSDDMEFEE